MSIQAQQVQAQQVLTIPRPMQAGAITVTGTQAIQPAQLDITTIMNLLIPMIMIVMIMKVMTSAIGEKP